MEKCKHCGGDMRYSTETGDVRCANCGNILTMDFQKSRKKSWLIILIGLVLAIVLVIFVVKTAQCNRQYKAAMEAYENGYLHKVSQETYEKMEYALERIEARIKGE